MLLTSALTTIAAAEKERIKQRELYVQKKWEHDGVSHALTKVIQEELGIEGVTAEVYDKYYVQGGDADNGLPDDEFELARKTIFAELPLETTLEKNDFYGKVGESEIIDIADVPGQFSQRTDSVEKSLLAQCGRDFGGKVKSNHVIVLRWKVTPAIRKKIHDWVINPVEKVEQKRDDKIFPDPEKSPENYRILNTCAAELDKEWNPTRYEEFNALTEDEYRAFAKHGGISLEVDDFIEVQKYFRDVEKRNPTYTELKLIETYWSDHCRHTTFHTAIENIEITGNTPEIIADIKASQKAFEGTLEGREKTLMNLAIAGFRKIKGENKLWDSRTEYDSLENNACSYETEIENEKWEKEKWVIMFKNETHNSPTETEPFGGAATCIGGCIRDPLSGGTYTFQAMRISGSGNPTERLDETMAGKLSQKFISLVSALGYSSYGNQIGLATGMVREFFHPGYKAKHLELGYVVAAAPKWHNKRAQPKKGDIVLMVGGRTGRDGEGGATVSSKEQGTNQDAKKMGAHVQKGNAPEERKLQRLLLNPEFAKMIIKCNDFGAGGVSVAVWELARGLYIDLDAVKTKYSGLSDTSLAHSESQERMAFVIDPQYYDEAMAMIEAENLEWVQVAEVTDDHESPQNDRLKMTWKWHKVVDLSRNFLDSMGAKKIQKKALVTSNETDFFGQNSEEESFILRTEEFLQNLQKLGVASQQWLGSIFDSSVGASTILASYGGKHQKSPQIGMAAKIPSLHNDDGLDFKTAIISAFGGNPHLSDSSPYLAGMYAVIDAISRTVAMGGDIDTVWLTAQEYFWKLGKEDARWGEIYGIMLWFFRAQIELNVPAIGGKDSASGTFKKSEEVLHVPTTLFTVANSPQDSAKIVSAEFQDDRDMKVIYFPFPRDEAGLPDWEKYRTILEEVSELHRGNHVTSASVVEEGGVAATIAKMCFGNQIWFVAQQDLGYGHDMGGIILELKGWARIPENAVWLWTTSRGKFINFPGGEFVTLEEAQKAWENPLEKVYSRTSAGGPVEAIKPHTERGDPGRMPILFGPDGRIISGGTAPTQVNLLTKKPKVVIPVFPGTNSELDTKHALHKSGFTDVEIFVFKTKTPAELTESFAQFAKLVWEAQMIVLPGGFSGADEPGGSAKFANTIFRSTKVRDAMNAFLQKPNTLTLGICNGFQMLMKLGVFEKGEISDFQTETDMTLAHNTNGRHVTDLVGLKVTSVLSPFFNTIDIGDTFIVPISHEEGRIVFSDEKQFLDLLAKWQIVLQYLDADGNPTNAYNGSAHGVAGICSPDGRILGLMPHPERSGLDVFKNVPGNKHLWLFDGAAEALGVKPKYRRTSSGVFIGEETLVA